MARHWETARLSPTVLVLIDMPLQCLGLPNA